MDPHTVQKAGKGVQLAAFRRNKVIKSKDDQTLAPGIGLIYETDRQTAVQGLQSCHLTVLSSLPPSSHPPELGLGSGSASRTYWTERLLSFWSNKVTLQKCFHSNGTGWKSVRMTWGQRSKSEPETKSPGALATSRGPPTTRLSGRAVSQKTSAEIQPKAGSEGSPVKPSGPKEEVSKGFSYMESSSTQACGYTLLSPGCLPTPSERRWNSQEPEATQDSVKSAKGLPGTVALSPRLKEFRQEDATRAPFRMLAPPG